MIKVNDSRFKYKNLEFEDNVTEEYIESICKECYEQNFKCYWFKISKNQKALDTLIERTNIFIFSKHPLFK